MHQGNPDPATIARQIPSNTPLCNGLVVGNQSRRWSLFNAFTKALKGNLIELPRCTEALHGLLDNHVGLALPC